MLKTILAGLKARTARLILSSVAIALGVAFVTGTLVLGDAIEAQTRDEFARSARNVDAVVQAKDDRIDEAMVAKIRQTKGVEGADGREFQGAAFVPGNGGKARNALVSPLPTTEKLRDFDLKDGRFPNSATEAAVDRKTFETAKLKLGDKIKLMDSDGKEHEFTLVGAYQQGVNSASITGSDHVVLSPEGMRAIAPKASVYEVAAVAAPGVSQQQLVDNLKASLGDKVTVMTGEELTKKTLEQVAGQAGEIKLFLLAFALISLVVAAMVIYNTFTILIAQRTRELALLRCVGAARGQVFRSVLVEALFMGLAASVLGLLGGLGVSAGLQWAIGSIGSSGGDVTVRLPMTLTTVLAGFGVGVVVTVLAALLPARRATTVAPVAALRSLPDSHDEVARTGKLRIILAILVALVGAGAIGLGMRLKQEAAVFVTGGGTMVVLLAVLMLGPILVGPVNRLFGRALRGVPGKLASLNAGRNPKRTAATTAALMIGVTIVSMVGVVGNSGRETATAQVDKRFPTDYTITSSVYDQPLTEEFATKIGQVAQVEKVAPEVNVGVKADGVPYGGLYLRGLPGDAVGTLVRPDLASGQLNGGLKDGEIALSEDTAKESALAVGSTLKAGAESLKVVAIYKGRELGEGLVSMNTARKLSEEPIKGYTTLLVKLKPGTDLAAARTALESVIATSPVATLNSAAEAKKEINQQIDQVLLFIWALVGLAVVIALFGIANTLTLSVLERTRESALLRALGLTKGQLRQMLVVESILMALIGATIGLALGVGFGWILTTAMSTDKFSLTFAVPYGSIGAMLAAAVVAAIVAAALPARRAARTSVVAGMAEA
ncbi:ABC transporter substrate-binding protein [Lentzea sp. NBRC 105346]|uniref:ABC transporter permease n=1 Tax=Lentzea sp. NBRC 105346 TaxID=3032205 RepID=UPI0024A4FA9B|nr:ABC transporter permease [Lentzea sp. NBRC 105346]GLZ29626.1 ABC transporter substrate-binding protein [Lentzea sp. NBRC 105346]